MSNSPSDSEVADLRAAYRQTMRLGSGHCPGDEELSALVVGELLASDRQRLVDHLVGCRSCCDSYRTLQELHAEASAGEPAPASRRRWRAGLAFAAAVLAALGLFRLFAPPGPAQQDGAETALRSALPLAAAVDPPDGAVGPAPRSLSWPAQVGATGYRVVLFDAAAEPIWESEVSTELSLEVPESIRPSLIAGDAYFWVVRTRGLAERSELGPFWFEVDE